MHPEVNEIRAKILTTPWPKFLRSISIDGFRGWSGEEVEFKFPVTVLTGENGSGKSTVLMAAAAAYQDPNRRQTYSPSAFFKLTPWDQYGTANIRYRIREGTTDRTYAFKKPQSRWRMSGRPRRDVLYSTIARTLPIENATGSGAIASARAAEATSRTLDPTLKVYYSSVLGRQYDNVRIATANVSPRELGVVSLNGAEFSPFHQGAGEASTLELMAVLGSLPATALVVIDEVEASLHPRSQRRFVHFLLWLARTRHIQIILSTHSQYILEELPLEARVFLNRSAAGVDVLYGVSTAFALTRMDDYHRPDLCIYVEDDEAATLLRTILIAKGFDLTPVQILTAGPSNMVLAVANLAARNRLPMAALAVVDGDKTPRDGAIALPGTVAPEVLVFTDAATRAADVAVRLGITEAQASDGLRTAMTLTDHHAWVGHFANRIGRGAAYVWETMCDWWARDFADEDALEVVVAAVQTAVDAARAARP